MPDRLSYHAKTYDEVYQYFATRHLQMAPHGYKWSFELSPQEGGYTTHLYGPDGKTYDSFYVTEQGKGFGVKMLKLCTNRILTIGDCQIVEWLIHHDADFEVVHGIFDTPEYRMIQRVYGNDRANRSDVLKMNHIDEGLYVLSKIGASPVAMKAFCLHPLLQLDPDLAEHFDAVVAQCDKRSVALALEYRNLANNWMTDKVYIHDGGLGGTWPTSDSKPKLSPLEGVNRMLIADKVQNYKDFILHHQGKHWRTHELTFYFDQWLNALGVTNFDDLFLELCNLHGPQAVEGKPTQQ